MERGNALWEKCYAINKREREKLCDKRHVEEGRRNGGSEGGKEGGRDAGGKNGREECKMKIRVS